MRPRLPFGNNKVLSEPEQQNDPTDWLINSGFAEFILLHTISIKYMIMFGYTYMAGCKLFTSSSFASPSNTTSMIFQYVSMILQCTGGGIIVPVLLNGIPVPIGQDSYIIFITISFIIHYYFPMIRDVTIQSSILYCSMIVMYEILRAYVVVKFITIATDKIPPSEFSIPVFGPIICGTIAGCGAAFIPFNKGLVAIQQSLIPPVLSAGVGSIVYHFVVNGTTLLEPKASAKGQVVMAIFFIAYHISITDFHHHSPTKVVDVKKQQ